MRERTRIGYIGVDVLNNATICNEVPGLLDAGVTLDLVSVYRFEKPTFYKEKSLAAWASGIYYLYPLRLFAILWDLLRAPFVFRQRFFSALWKAVTAECEGPKQRLRVWLHFLPGLRLAYYWRGRDIGHIHAQWAHTATTIAMHAAELLGVGFSFTGHANDIFVHRVALAEKIRRARFIVCIAEYHRRFYLDLGADPNRLHVVYCGIDLERFKDLPDAEPVDGRIVSVGRLVEKKGFHNLIKACAQLRDREISFECIIAGSGPEEDRLRGLIGEHRLDEQVQITGEAILQEELPGFLRTAQIFSLPCVKDSDGDMDGLPQVLIESMACSVPAVSTHLVGIPDLMRHEENALMVETEDVDSLADAMERLLTDRSLRERFGTESAQWANAHFGRDQLVERLKTLFIWLAENEGNSAPDRIFGPAPASEACYDDPRIYKRGITEFIESDAELTGA